MESTPHPDGHRPATKYTAWQTVRFKIAIVLKIIGVKCKTVLLWFKELIQNRA